MSKSEYLCSLNKKIEKYYEKEREKSNEILRQKIELENLKKKIYDEKIDFLVDIYYPLIINNLEHNSIRGKNEGFLILDKRDFIIDENKNIKYNCRIMINSLLQKYYRKLNGLKYDILIDKQLILHLIW